MRTLLRLCWSILYIYMYIIRILFDGIIFFSGKRGTVNSGSTLSTLKVSFGTRDGANLHGIHFGLCSMANNVVDGI